MTTKANSLYGSSLKILACIFMFIDHLAASLLDNYIYTLSDDSGIRDFLLIIDDVMRCIGRLAFPIFCFLMVEGLKYTRNRLKYLRNLAIFAVIAEVPFDLALFGGQWIDIAHQNVFFTLLLSAALMCLISLICKGKYESRLFTPLAYLGGLFFGLIVYVLWPNSYFGQAFSYAADSIINPTVAGLFSEFVACIAIIVYLTKTFTMLREQRIRDCLCLMAVLVAIIIAILIGCDYGAFGVMTVAVMYTLNSRVNAAPIRTYAWGCAVLAVLNPIEAFAFFGIFLIGRYNHQRGLNFKYLFYAFYPCHLLLFYFIGLLIGLY